MADATTTAAPYLLWGNLKGVALVVSQRSA